MYCMYLRKSRADIEAEARGEEETLARHENILWELAKKLNIPIKKEHIYREVVSGETIASRPVMQQLLAEVEQGLWEGILVVEIERLARGDTMDQGLVAQTFKYSGTKIITPMKIYDPNNEFDEEYFEFGLFMSRREYKVINRRLQRGRLEAIKEGKYVGNKPPYGYVRKKLEGQKGFTLEPHPEQAKIVKMIFDWYTSGIGVSLICNKLHEIQVPTAKGGPWSVSTVRGILTNPVYIGKVRWNFRPQIKKMEDGKIVRERPRASSSTWTIEDGLHESIISEEQFNLAQKIMAENPSTPAPKHLGIKNPLAGIIVCGVCGRNMVRRPYSKYKYPDTLICTTTGCNNISSHLSVVEEKLLQALAQWLDKYKIAVGADLHDDTAKTEVKLITESINKISKELKKLEKQQNSLHDLLEQRVYSIETFLERSKLLGEKIKAAKDDKKRFEQELDKLKQREKNKIEVIPKVEKVVNLYWELEDPADKNKLLKEALEKVVYIKTADGRCVGNRPDNFELTLYPKLPK